MNTGRELDALVAEKVMGWQKRPASGYTHEVWYPPGEEELNPNSTQQQRGPQPLPNFSENIVAAWEVAEKFRESCKDVGGICIKAHNSGWTIHTGYYADWQASEATTFPHAICLAALKGVGYEEGK